MSSCTPSACAAQRLFMRTRTRSDRAGLYLPSVGEAIALPSIGRDQQMDLHALARITGEYGRRTVICMAGTATCSGRSLAKATPGEEQQQGEDDRANTCMVAPILEHSAPLIR
jgi:hypothetical protein